MRNKAAIPIKTVRRMLICAAFSIGVVLLLVLFSHQLIHRYNSFLRIFPPYPLEAVDTVDLGYNSYYPAGGTQHRAYLGNYTAPLRLVAYDFVRRDTQHISITIDSIQTMLFWSVTVRVDSPEFFVLDGAVPKIFRGGVKDWYGFPVKPLRAFFIEAVPIGNNSFGMRSKSAVTNEYVLGKHSSSAGGFHPAPDLLQKQVDGVFCTDGTLLYSPSMERLVYVYYYRNEFIVTDTSLNLDYRGKTIDTVSRAQIQTAGISSGRIRTLARPPLLVNKRSAIGGRYLLVNSGLMAKNESPEIFARSSVIDVYDLSSGKYRFSFHLADVEGHKLRSFQAYGDHLVAVFDRYLVTYALQERYFRSP